MSKENKIVNFYEHKSVQKKMDKNDISGYLSDHIPLNSRIACVGASGSGKSNWLLNFLSVSTNSFSHIYVCYKSSEPLYEHLAEKVGDDNITFFTDLSLFPDCNDLPPGNKLIVFDDQVGENKKKQEVISQYSIRGRKKGCTMLILSQSWFGIPKLQRLQVTVLILLKVSSSKDLNMLLKDFSLGVSRDELLQMYKTSVEGGFGNFMKIDTNTNDRYKKFSKNWNQFFNIRSEFDSDSDSDEKIK